MRRPQKGPLVLTKQLVLLSSVKRSGRFFQIFVAFTEKLDFNLCKSNTKFLSESCCAILFQDYWFPEKKHIFFRCAAAILSILLHAGWSSLGPYGDSVQREWYHFKDQRDLKVKLGAIIECNLRLAKKWLDIIC